MLYHKRPLSSLRCSGMASVNEGLHTHVYPQLEWTILAFTSSCRASSTFGYYSFPTEDSRLSWPGWLDEIRRWFVHLQMFSRHSTNWARHEITSLICQLPLLLCQTATVVHETWSCSDVVDVILDCCMHRPCRSVWQFYYCFIARCRVVLLISTYIPDLCIYFCMQCCRLRLVWSWVKSWLCDWIIQICQASIICSRITSQQVWHVSVNPLSCSFKKWGDGGGGHCLVWICLC